MDERKRLYEELSAEINSPRSKKALYDAIMSENDENKPPAVNLASSAHAGSIDARIVRP